jgi:hypothetical protein
MGTVKMNPSIIYAKFNKTTFWIGLKNTIHTFDDHWDQIEALTVREITAVVKDRSGK